LNPGEIAIPLVQEDLKSTGMTLNESSSIDLDGLSFSMEILMETCFR
jgi:hypothetical protein